MRVSKKDREAIYHKCGGRCAYCGDELQKGWHVDHIQAIRRNPDGSAEHPENHNTENMMPSCPSCNINKHQMTPAQFKTTILNYVNSLNNYSTQYKIAKKYNLIKETKDQKITFYYETLGYEI